jgi:enamine deaminase RidA (YjgF/YER057c/UK114 family)
MAPIERVFTEKAPKPLPQFSQAVKYNGMVYCSGNIGFDPATFKLVDGGIKEETVSTPISFFSPTFPYPSWFADNYFD